MAFAALPDVLNYKVVHVNVGGWWGVSELVSGVVYSIYKEGDCGEGFCGGDVAVTQEERVEVGVLLLWQVKVAL